MHLTYQKKPKIYSLSCYIEPYMWFYSSNKIINDRYNREVWQKHHYTKKNTL